MNDTIAIILAAGKGVRMKSSLPKVSHPLCGQPMIGFALDQTQKLELPTWVVVGKDSKPLTDYLTQRNSPLLHTALQDPPLGTGHAVLMALEQIKNDFKHALILCGDMPLLRAETLSTLLETHRDKNAALSLATIHLTKNHLSFGRILRDAQGLPSGIREVKDASPDELKINEGNVALYVLSADFLKKFIGKLSTSNAQGEYYLTDLVEMAHKEGLKIISHLIDDPTEALGINTQLDLSRAEAALMERRRNEFMLEGVRFANAGSCLIDHDVKIASGTFIMGPVSLLEGSSIGAGCTIEPGSVIKKSTLEEGVVIKANCYIQESHIEKGSSVGPFAHLRPGTQLGAHVKIGNFVETKKALFKEGAKASHLSYIGDAEVGKNTNIGAGTITCNYDGVNKFKTVLGDNVFVGSDTQFVAPITVGEGAFIGAGSTITKDVSPGSLALSRSQQVEVRAWKKKKNKP